MAVVAPQTVQITCPNCRNPFRTQIYSLIDVQEQPILKQALLAGQLNVAVCPRCGAGSMLGAPIVYHDAEKQLCLVYFPQELNAPPQEQERFIGDATGLLIRSLPPNAPKGYLLNPRRFISLNTLIEAIFEADGVSKEMLEAQRKRVDLIAALAEAMDGGDEQLAQVVQQRRGELNEEFFTTLLAFAQANAQQGQAQGAQMLLELRAKVAELAGFDLDDAEGGEGEEDYEAAQDEAVERLMAAEDAEVEGLVAELRPVIDYGFFQLWTARIETVARGGDAAEAQRLTERRARIVELVEQMDQQAQAMFESGTAVLRAVLDAPDIEAALREQGDKLDEGFLMVVGVNAEAAEHGGNSELAERLRAIGAAAATVIEERMTPEDRFIRQLVSQETPQESTKLLRRSVAQITPALVKRINELADQEAGSPAGDRLRQLGREAGAMLF